MTRASARITDPGTSWHAAREVERSGRAQAQRELVLETLRKHPGSTAAEIAALAGMERHQPSRRLPELEKDGLVCRGLPRVCREQGSKCVTWHAEKRG